MWSRCCVGPNECRQPCWRRTQQSHQYSVTVRSTCSIQTSVKHRRQGLPEKWRWTSILSETSSPVRLRLAGPRWSVASTHWRRSVTLRFHQQRRSQRRLSRQVSRQSLSNRGGATRRSARRPKGTLWCKSVSNVANYPVISQEQLINGIGRNKFTHRAIASSDYLSMTR